MNLKTKYQVGRGAGSWGFNLGMKLRKVLPRIMFNWEGFIAWYQKIKGWIGAKVCEPHLG